MSVDRRTAWLRTAALWMGACAGAPAIAQSLAGIGWLPGHTHSAATGVSGDGSVVCGYSGDDTTTRPVRWREFTLLDLGVIPGGTYAFASALSADGATIVGAGDVPDADISGGAFRWRESEGLLRMTGLPSEISAFVNAVNSDGTVSVGNSQRNLFPAGLPVRACVWNGGLVATELAPAGSLGYSAAAAVSGNGATIGGTHGLASDATGSRSAPALWTGGTLQLLPMLPHTRRGGVSGLNGDGTVAVGSMDDETLPDTYGFLWTAAGGMHALPRTDETYYCSPTGVSGDGKVVVGWITPRTTSTYAFLYKKSLGIVPLRDYLLALGADVTGWELGSANAISADGTTIVGEGVHNGVSEGFIANIGKDTDEDGLLDQWEMYGIPYIDSTGASQVYILDADGDGVNDADPYRKDIFVEIDAMFGYADLMNYLDPVIEAFDRAPVPAPDVPGGKPGVALHLQRAGTGDIRDFPNVWSDFQSMKRSRFGHGAEISSFNHIQLLGAKARAYRYCIFGRTWGTTDDETRSSGLAEGIGCNDFMVTLGGWHLATYFTADEIRGIVAGTFMHELGHALGLRHGGGDDINYKPNYFSTMNYNWQTPDSSYAAAGAAGQFQRFFPDFSRQQMPTLEESALLETAGVTASPPDPDLLFPWSIQLGNTDCDSLQACSASDDYTYCRRYTYFDVEVDWNNDCSISPTPVSADINNPRGDIPTPDQSLIGFNDWPNLLYDFKGRPYSADGVVAPTAPAEITVDEYLASRHAPARPACVTIGMTDDLMLCPGHDAVITASPVGAGPFTYRWQALSSTGRVIGDLTDGEFTDAVTGLSYVVFGTDSDHLTVSDVRLGRHPSTIKFAAVVRNPCGATFGPATTVTVRACGYECFADYDGSGGTPDLTDITEFFNGWLAGDECADVDCSGGTPDLTDITVFFDAWLAGGC